MHVIYLVGILIACGYYGHQACLVGMLGGHVRRVYLVGMFDGLMAIAFWWPSFQHKLGVRL